MICVTFSLPHFLTEDRVTVRFQRALTNQGQSHQHKIPRPRGWTHRPFPSRTITLVNDWCSLWARLGVEEQAPDSGKISRKLQFSHFAHPSFHMPSKITPRKAYLSSSLAGKYCISLCLFIVPAIRSDASGVGVTMWFWQRSVPTPPHLPQASPHHQGWGWTTWREGSSGWQKMSVFTLWLPRTRPPLTPSLPSQISFLPTALPHQSGLARVLGSCLSQFALEMLLILKVVRAPGGHSLKYHWTGT